MFEMTQEDSGRAVLAGDLSRLGKNGWKNLHLAHFLGHL